MAERRMFAKSVVQSDAFMDMPLTAQALFFHLGMEADDDGFLNNAKRIMRAVGSAMDDMRILITKGFVLDLGDGIQVLTHWKANNYLRNDRYKPTVHEDKKRLLICDNKGKYALNTGGIANGMPMVYQMDTQDRIGKDSIGEDSIESIRSTEKKKSIQKREGTKAGKPPAHARGEYGWVKLTDDEYSHLITDLGECEAARVIAYVDESAQTTGNRNRWKDWNLVCRKASREGWGKNNQAAPKRREREYKNLEKQYQELERGTL